MVGVVVRHGELQATGKGCRGLGVVVGSCRMEMGGGATEGKKSSERTTGGVA